jgi:hypothetical protein
MKTYAATLSILFAALLHRFAAQTIDFNIFELDGTFHACPNSVDDNCDCLDKNNDGATIDATDSNIQQVNAVWTITGLCGQPPLDVYTFQDNSGHLEANVYIHDANPAQLVGICAGLELVPGKSQPQCTVNGAQVTLFGKYECQGVCS